MPDDLGPSAVPSFFCWLTMLKRVFGRGGFPVTLLPEEVEGKGGGAGGPMPGLLLDVSVFCAAFWLSLKEMLALSPSDTSKPIDASLFSKSVGKKKGGSKE